MSRSGMQSVNPVFNRCVVFSTTSAAFHGHPDPLQCPPDVTRKSVALYYYTNGRPASEEYDGHNTLFQRRPGTSDATKPRRSARDWAKLLTPPILLPSRSGRVRASWRAGGRAADWRRRWFHRQSRQTSTS